MEDSGPRGPVFQGKVRAGKEVDRIPVQGTRLAKFLGDQTSPLQQTVGVFTAFAGL